MTYVYHLVVLLTIYIILTCSLNLLVGYCGILSMAHAAFYGIGAYTSALLAIRFHFNFLICLLIAVALAMLLSFFVAGPALRLRGDYIVLASLAFQVILSDTLNNWTELTNGPLGLLAIPRPSLGRVTLNTVPAFLLLSGLICVVSLFASHRILNSPFGLTLKGIRDDEVATIALGKRVAAFKISAFVIASGFAATAGFLLASYASFIDPTSFTLNESISILAIVLVGGSGNLRGPLLGTLFAILIPEGLRFFNIPGSVAANIRQIIYGLLLIVLMRFRPQGIAGEYRFD